MATVTLELVWISGLFKELEIGVTEPVRLFCDNKAALQIAANPVYHERTKHIEIDCHFVREKIQEGLIATEYVSTTDQLAVVMMKALGSQQHSFDFQVGVKKCCYTSSLRGSVEKVIGC
ncbi:Copia [Gossypium arboreum]|uniref:Copia n=1 Tax=Gossypium arboreum TaxID=29729 RepID=A0A0B0PXZ3_GOSAR|nr:Copia [Gossypium arboreum]